MKNNTTFDPQTTVFRIIAHQQSMFVVFDNTTRKVVACGCVGCGFITTAELMGMTSKEVRALIDAEGGTFEKCVD